MTLSDSDRERIQGLIGVYFQVSRAYGHVMRLPYGKTGMEALRESGGQRCDDEEWIQGLGEEHCGDYYLRVHAPNSQRVRLTPEEFNYYRHLGGRTYR